MVKLVIRGTKGCEKATYNEVPGYERYLIDRSGNVYSTHSKRLLKQEVDKDGYRRVTLTMGGKSKHFGVHRLVAMAYINNPKAAPEVNHKDGNKENNDVSNLEWVTTRENIQHAIKLGLRENRPGHSHRGVVKIFNGEAIATFKSTREAARKTGVNQARIVICCRGNGKSAGGFQWEYTSSP